MAGETVKLAVRNVRKSFRIRGRRESEDRILNVLRDVSFDVRQGEVVSLIGESGCGKTTCCASSRGWSLRHGRSWSTASPSRSRDGTAASCSSMRPCCHGDRPGRTSSSAWSLQETGKAERKAARSRC